MNKSYLYRAYLTTPQADTLQVLYTLNKITQNYEELNPVLAWLKRLVFRCFFWFSGPSVFASLEGREFQKVGQPLWKLCPKKDHQPPLLVCGVVELSSVRRTDFRRGCSRCWGVWMCTSRQGQDLQGRRWVSSVMWDLPGRASGGE